MIVYTLIGSAGTGKSYQSMNLLSEYGIEGLVDDGLFIYNGKIEEGISAKRQTTKVGAIKTALFTKEEHRAAVAAKIKELDPPSVLVIATSEEMADRILDRLELPRATHVIHIEDITTEEEREQAARQRLLQGKHVIPAPTLQLKRTFAGYFLDPLRILKEPQKENRSEKTVVRPTYSYMGDFFISDAVLTDIAECVAMECEGVSKVLRVYENDSPDSLSMTVSVAMEQGSGIMAKAAEYQHRLASKVEDMTAFNVVRVDVEIRQLAE